MSFVSTNNTVKMKIVNFDITNSKSIVTRNNVVWKYEL